MSLVHAVVVALPVHILKLDHCHDGTLNGLCPMLRGVCVMVPVALESPI